MSGFANDNKKRDISIDFNTPSDISAETFDKLEIRKVAILFDDHYVAEGSMSPIQILIN